MAEDPAGLWLATAAKTFAPQKQQPDAAPVVRAALRNLRRGKGTRNFSSIKLLIQFMWVKVTTLLPLKLY